MRSMDIHIKRVAVKNALVTVHHCVGENTILGSYVWCRWSTLQTILIES